MDSTLTSEFEDAVLDDQIDEFCYDLAQAIRRLLGIPTLDSDGADEEEIQPQAEAQNG